MADVIVDREEQIPTALEQMLAFGERVPSFLIFVSGDLAAQVLQSVESATARKMVVVVHNSDFIPTSAIAEQAHRFGHIFSVNWMGSNSRVTPIPIGVENAWIGVNGQLKSFQALLPSRQDKVSLGHRSIPLLVAISETTNAQERSGLRDLFAQVPGSMVLHNPVGHSEYLNLLSKSVYVLSPPGNGLDCHRTWEAIYSGAIPIVLQRAWPFESLNLPVIAVPDWDDALSMLMDPERRSKAAVVRSRPSNSAFMPYFVHLIEQALESLRSGLDPVLGRSTRTG